MTIPEKTREIIDKFYEFTRTGKKEPIEKYTLEEIKQASCHYKHDNSKLPDLASFMNYRIQELENIYADKKRKKEKWLDKLFTFTTGIVVTLIVAYLKGCLKLEVK